MDQPYRDSGDNPVELTALLGNVPILPSPVQQVNTMGFMVEAVPFYAEHSDILKTVCVGRHRQCWYRSLVFT